MVPHPASYEVWTRRLEAPERPFRGPLAKTINAAAAGSRWSPVAVPLSGRWQLRGMPMTLLHYGAAIGKAD